MPNGFASKDIQGWVLSGIEAAFDEWHEMSGEWLHTAPEYLLTVKVAQKLKSAIPAGKRTLLMEPQVAKTLADAGGVQRGPNALKLRAGGRYDIILGHGNRLPRVIIELKNPLWTPMGKAVLGDLHRICRSLLQGKAKTQLYSGVFAFYTSSSHPKRKDFSAKDRLERKWLTEWVPKLNSWTWAKQDQNKYSKHLKISVSASLHEQPFKSNMHAWAAVCVQITRKPRKRTAPAKAPMQEETIT